MSFLLAFCEFFVRFLLAFFIKRVYAFFASFFLLRGFMRFLLAFFLKKLINTFQGDHTGSPSLAQVQR